MTSELLQDPVIIIGVIGLVVACLGHVVSMMLVTSIDDSDPEQLYKRTEQGKKLINWGIFSLVGWLMFSLALIMYALANI